MKIIFKNHLLKTFLKLMLFIIYSRKIYYLQVTAILNSASIVVILPDFG